MAQTTQTALELLDHSPDFDSRYRRRRERERAQYRRVKRRVPFPFLGDHESVADPEDVSSYARRRKEAYGDYFGQESGGPRGRGDGAMALPECEDLQALADTFGTSPERLTQAVEMQRRGLDRKPKRFTLCGLLGHRVNCSEHDEHKFLQLYTCHCRYCATCGPAWFRRKFSDLSVVLEPVIEHLLHEGQKHGRDMVVAKLDFTIPNTGTMPASDSIREFHRNMHRFWRLVERFCGVSRSEYGQAGCDEFGGGNTNLHRHSLYVGPELPQRNKELSALWSIACMPGKRRREMLRFIRKQGLVNAWGQLADSEWRFVSIKHARSFRAALAHALKYPAKFLSASTPERLAELEAAFHRTRRFSTGGVFYRLKVMREPGEDSPVGSCPLCGARLCEVVEPWVSRFALEAEGRRDVDLVRRETARATLLSQSGPP